MPSLGEIAGAAMPSIQAKLAVTSGPINVVAKITAEPAHADTVADLLKQVALVANSDKEPQTLTYRISRGISEQNNRFVVYEEYAAPEALSAHLASPQFQALSAFPNVENAELDIYKEY
ncbi:hypothetical protein E3P99_00748 [Wallemia hederae]|uniref:ABM domain-containing protein n=1 Tax=Wallemia hederae TaxID=1540922 RepID=A0A4T0FTR1_9BASI|nr:hypothetical protein E3P99_00748 [Wallemia hederae]